MLPVNWMRCSRNKNRPFTSRKKAGSSTIQVWDDPLQKMGRKSPEILRFQDFFLTFAIPLVEISGIEPLTS